MLTATTTKSDVSFIAEKRESLIRMLELMNEATSQDLDNPLLPSAVPSPRNESYRSKPKYWWDVLSIREMTVTEWPDMQLAAWGADWNTLASLADLDTPFPVQVIDANDVNRLDSNPNSIDLVNKTISFLLDVQEAFPGLPVHPRIGRRSKGSKPFKAPWLVISLISAAVVGGALIYTQRAGKWPFRTKARMLPNE